MVGWKADTERSTSIFLSFELATGFAKGRPGPEKKLRLEQEF